MTPRRMNQVLWACIATLVVGAVVVIYVGNAKLTSVAHDTAKLKAEVEASNKQIATYQVTKAKVESLGYVNELANKVLPPEKEQSAIVAEISQFALRSDLSVKGITFVTTANTAPTTAQKKNLAIPKGVEVVPISITFVEGSQYQNVLDFLQTAENNQRKMQVTSVTLKPDSTDANYLAGVTIEMNLYAKQATQTGATQ